MPPNSQEQDAILRNINLITTPRNTLVFLIAPFLSWSWLAFTVHRLPHGGILATRTHFIFALLISPMLVLVLAMWTGEKIEEELKKSGYVQHRTRARWGGLLLSWAALGAFYFWFQGYRHHTEGGLWAVRGIAVLGGLELWWFMILMSIGPMLWFTVRAR